MTTRGKAEKKGIETAIKRKTSKDPKNNVAIWVSESQERNE